MGPGQCLCLSPHYPPPPFLPALTISSFGVPTVGPPLFPKVPMQFRPRQTNRDHLVYRRSRKKNLINFIPCKVKKAKVYNKEALAEQPLLSARGEVLIAAKSPAEVQQDEHNWLPHHRPKLFSLCLQSPGGSGKKIPGELSTPETQLAAHTLLGLCINLMGQLSGTHWGWRTKPITPAELDGGHWELGYGRDSLGRGVSWY